MVGEIMRKLVAVITLTLATVSCSSSSDAPSLAALSGGCSVNSDCFTTVHEGSPLWT